MRQTINRFCVIFSCAVALAVTVQNAQAEGSATGSDMWTRAFEQWGLYHPHANNCDSSTEVFADFAGTGLGYCIEKNERGSAVEWQDAREDCALDKKRLPEPFEFRYACLNVAGFSNDSSDYEWASNFGIPMFFSTTSYGIVGSMVGSSNCKHMAWNWAGRVVAGGALPTLKYRCVR